MTRDDISIVEQSTGMRYNSDTHIRTAALHRGSCHVSASASASTVTGSHNFKAGLQFEESYLEIEAETATTVEYAFNRGVPVSLTQWATPYGSRRRTRTSVLRAGSVDARSV